MTRTAEGEKIYPGRQASIVRIGSGMPARLITASGADWPRPVQLRSQAGCEPWKAKPVFEGRLEGTERRAMPLPDGDLQSQRGRLLSSCGIAGAAPDRRAMSGQML